MHWYTCKCLLNTLVNEGCCTQFPGRLVFFRRQAFQKIAAIYLVFTFRILENRCSRSALITALFTMGGTIYMETKCLWLIFKVHRTQIIPSLDPKM